MKIAKIQESLCRDAPSQDLPVRQQRPASSATNKKQETFPSSRKHVNSCFTDTEETQHVIMERTDMRTTRTDYFIGHK